MTESKAAAKPAPGGYRPDIDGLRAVAVMAVVLHHLSSRWVPGGFIGVDVFFVISGYLITKIIHREMEDGSFTFARFYERRIRRLFPALFTVIVFVLVAGWFLLLPSDYLATFRAAAGTVLFSANIVFWRDLAEGYFAADAKLNPLLHMWSLGVEEQFYLLFPLVLLMIHRYARTWLIPVLWAGLFASLALSIVLTPIKSVASYFLLPTRAWEMLVGSLLGVIALPQPSRRVWREILAGSAILAIVAPAFLFDSATPFPGYAALVPVAGCAALIWLGSGPATSVGRLLSLRPIVYVGLISYSLYLWHWPLIVFAKFQNGMAPIDHWLPGLMLLSISIAALSHRFIETGFRRGSGSTRRSPLFIGASAATFGLFAISITGIAKQGFDKRVNQEVLALDKERDPQIPFRDCDGRRDGCLIGVDSGGASKPSVLLWGDSHMLAWAPVLDRVLKEQGLSARLQIGSACPPVFEVSNGANRSCAELNRGVKHRIESGEFDAVVLAAFWSTYSDRKNPNMAVSGYGAVVSDALPATLRSIEAAGAQPSLIGPLPVYEQDIPTLRAVSAWKGRDVPVLQTIKSHRERNSEFFQVAGSGYRMMDPALSICIPECRLEDDVGKGMYRDANHLSVPGSMYWYADIYRLVENLTTKTSVIARE